MTEWTSVGTARMRRTASTEEREEEGEVRDTLGLGTGGVYGAVARMVPL